MLAIYDNIFSYDFIVKSYMESLELPWNYTNIANRFQYPTSSILSKGSHLFFGKRIYEKKGLFNIKNNSPDIFLEVIEHFVKNVIQDTSIDLVAIDCNFQLCGQDGTAHSDFEKNKISLTAIYYPVIDWKSEWGGALEILDNDKIVDRIYPVPGRMVFFDSSIYHRSVAPTIPEAPKISIAYRLNKNAT